MATPGRCGMARWNALVTVVTMVLLSWTKTSGILNGGHVAVGLIEQCWTVTTEAQFRGTRAPTMVPMSTGPTHMIVLTIHARVATTSPLPGCWCVHNTARRAAADHGASGAFPGVEEPRSGSGRSP